MLIENESVLGLQLDFDVIKVAYLIKASGGLKLIKAGILAVPENTVKNGIIVEPKQAAAAIREFLLLNNITAHKAVGVLSSSVALVRLLRLPFMAENELNSLLERELGRYADFKHEEKVVDYCLIDEVHEGGVRKINVACAVALKDTVNSIIQVAELAGLELTGIDVATLAVIHALEGANITLQSIEPMMLVIIDKEDIQLCIVKGNRLRFIHTVKTDLAENVKNQAEFLNRLVFSIKLVQNYYSTSAYGQEDISRIIISLNTHLLKEVDKQVSVQLAGFKIEKADPLARINIDKEHFTSAELDNLGLSFAPAIGAVLHLEDSPDYSTHLNLIPVKRQQVIQLRKELKFYAGILGALFAAFFVFGVLFWAGAQAAGMRLARVERQLEDMRTQVSGLVAEWENKEIAEKKINEAQKIIAEALRNKFPAKAGLIAEVMLAVPKGLWLTNVSLVATDTALVVSGEALNESLVSEYVNLMNRTGYFIKLEPQISAGGEKTTVTFTLKCSLKI